MNEDATYAKANVEPWANLRVISPGTSVTSSLWIPFLNVGVRKAGARYYRCEANARESG
jgi:hypothetical protein